MESKATYQKWSAQLRKGYLELCVLVVIQQKQSSYGLEVLQTLERSGLAVNEGTLYPLLNRMFKNNWLTSDWITPSEGGHPRRHYQLSEEGLSLLPQMLEAFPKQSNIARTAKEIQMNNAQYISALNKALAGLDKASRNDIIQEIKSHSLESGSALIEQFGSVDELAKQYLDGEKIAKPISSSYGALAKMC